MSEPILLEVSDRVALLTLNVPERRNAMTVPLCDGFAAAVRSLDDRTDVGALVITGAGRSFCAGADFSTLGELSGRTGTEGPPAMHGAIQKLYDAFLVLDRLDVPTVAAINGAAVGGGLGIALLCDLRVVSETAKIGANFARLGIHPGLGITQLLPATVGYEAAAELLFTGDLVLGKRAAELGLASKAVPAEQVLEEAMALAKRIAAAAPLAVRAIKRSLRLVTGRGLRSTLELESYAQVLLGQSRDASEGVAAMMGRRDPEFEGR